jgi:RNA polymerase sigma factor (sigma-70 family)
MIRSLPEAGFNTTHWSMVLTAAASGSAESAEALERLCRIYWYPLYAYVRQHGHDHQEAEDLTQAFIAAFLEKDYLSHLRPEHGRFRSYLLTALSHFLVDDWDRKNRQKRGGGGIPVRIDALACEARYLEELTDHDSPDRLFERRWALAVVHHVMDQLGSEYHERGKGRLFQALKGYLVADSVEASYAETAADLGMSEGAARIAVHRLRRRYGELFRAEIAGTVAGPEDVESEIRDLLVALSP